MAPPFWPPKQTPWIVRKANKNERRGRTDLLEVGIKPIAPVPHIYAEASPAI